MKIQIFLLLSIILITHNIKSQENLKKKENLICQFSTIKKIEAEAVCNSNPWIQVFEENFNGTIINSSVWKTDPQLRCRISNPERQYYQSENATVNNGILDIQVKKENEIFYAKTIDYLDNYELIPNTSFINLQPFQYTSADIETIKRFPNGKFEALIKIPKGKGLWPAFWLYNGDPNYNELDIFEFWSDSDPESQFKKVRTNSYREFFNNGKVYKCGDELTMFDCSFDYVKYTAIWDKSKIDWYVNDILIRSVWRYFNLTPQEICEFEAFQPIYEYSAFPNHSMNIILNVAVRNNEFKPNESDLFPKSMLVDWVKFYVRSDCSDKNITNISQFPISSQDYNYLVGDNIIIDCVYNLPQDNQLVIVANNSVTLNPGFTTELGSEFNVRIDPSVCTTSELSPNNNTLNSDIKEKNFKDDLDFTVFPNPSIDLINISFTNRINEFIEIKVKDVNGIEVLSKVLFKTNEIDISNLSAGYYFIEIYDKTDKKFIHKNFIKL